MYKKKVSIIVPIYNCENLLARCIKSILSQSYVNFELILVDDGSTDNSNTICREFEAIDDRVIVFLQKNSGASAARNVGIINSLGEYIMFVDADDYIENDMLQKLVNKAESENADFVMCGMTIDTYNKKGDLISSIECNLTPRVILGNMNIPKNIVDLVENEKINGPYCKLIKGDLIRKNNIKMPNHICLQEDLYFNLKILEHVQKMIVIEGCYYHYTKGLGKSVTSRYYPDKYEMINEVHDLLLTYYYERCNDPSIINRIKYIYIKNTFASFINLFHKDCNLTKDEKLNYIKRIINSKKYNEMISSAYKPGLKYKILLLLLRTKNKMLIYFSSKCFYIMKYSLGFRY